MINITPAKLSLESVYAVKNNNITYGYRPEPEYKDPLAKWPLRGLAFSSDIGMALKNYSSLLATLLWIPTLGYLGADIYDKYKYDKNKPSPSARRGLKETVFQAMASVVSPIILVFGGHKAGEFAAKAFKKTSKTKLFQTIGGFASIGLFAIPVDKLVEKKIMKHIAPKIDELNIQV